jgi:hypothetical protein
MSARPRRAYQFEVLEGRALLSTAHFLRPGVVEMVRAKAPRVQILSGTIRGTFQLSDANFDGNTTATINASGRVTLLGSVTATGTVTGIVGTPGAPLRGTLTLTGGQGSVVLGLSGTTPRSLRKLPRIQVTVEGGTGAFANASGQGTASITSGRLSSGSLSGSFSFVLRTTLKHG